MTPVSTKFALWIQPSEPFSSRLHGCRDRSKPSRLSAWASETVR
jgi:hypothetical protein